MNRKIFVSIVAAVCFLSVSCSGIFKEAVYVYTDSVQPGKYRVYHLLQNEDYGTGFNDYSLKEVEEVELSEQASKFDLYKNYTGFYLKSMAVNDSTIFIFYLRDKTNVEEEGPGDNIVIGDKIFKKTGFVEVIPKGNQVTIPDGENHTHIGDVFWEKRIITLSGYYISKYEVTQELYKAVIGSVPFADEENLYGSENQELRPVAGISWFDAVYFCNKLSEMCGLEPVYTITGIKYSNKGKADQYISAAEITWDFDKNGYRLPTEAEWEFAARGAGKTVEDWNYYYSGSDNFKKVGWTSGNSAGYTDDDVVTKTHEVGLKMPNALGIYDMTGNAYEWCMDWYRSVTEDNDFSHGNAVKDPGELIDPLPLKGKYDSHAIRGGAYNETPGMGSTGQRFGITAYTSYALGKSSYGLRLAQRK